MLHLDRLIDLKNESVAVREMRKHAAWYLKGVRGNASVRNGINACNTREDLYECVRYICRRSGSETTNNLRWLIMDIGD